jgi:hypothetical protein
MTISFAASRSFLSIRLGRFEVFAQRETAPAARYASPARAVADKPVDVHDILAAL